MKENLSSAAVSAAWKVISVETTARTQIKDITRDIAALVKQSGVESGVVQDRKSTRLNSSHIQKSRMPSSA